MLCANKLTNVVLAWGCQMPKQPLKFEQEALLMQRNRTRAHCQLKSCKMLHKCLTELKIKVTAGRGMNWVLSSSCLVCGLRFVKLLCVFCFYWWLLVGNFLALVIESACAVFSSCLMRTLNNQHVYCCFLLLNLRSVCLPSHLKLEAEIWLMSTWKQLTTHTRKFICLRQGMSYWYSDAFWLFFF